jgi:predicted RNA binding protein YcfA (HicA-like mRNA interferase family)
MSRLANCNHTSRVVRALERAGFIAEHGTNHTVMRHPDGRYTTVPRHRRVKPGLLRLILRQCGVSEDEFLTLYHGRRA